MWLAMFEEGCLCFLRRTAFKGSGAYNDGSADPGSLGPLLDVGTCWGSCTQEPTPGIHFTGPGGPVASSGSFTDVLSPLLCVRLCCFRTGTARGVMREAVALSEKEIGLGRETDLDLKLGSFTFSLKKNFF